MEPSWVPLPHSAPSPGSGQSLESSAALQDALTAPGQLQEPQRAGALLFSFG